MKILKRHFFLKEIRDECMKILNLMCGGDISQGNFKNINEIYIIYSRGMVRGKTIQDLGQRETNTTNGGVSWV